jgi:hypothetical protein
MKSPKATAALAAVAIMTFAPGVVRAQQADSTLRRQQQQLDSLKAVVRDALARLDSVAAAAAEAASAPAAPPSRSGAYMNIGLDGLVDGGWSSAKDVAALQKGDHDPKVRGFTIPQGELALDAVVDPYFKGFSNIVYKIDRDGETSVELEELYFLTTSLSHGLQLKGGQFLTDFGRQNATHPHAWSFLDQPLVLNRMFGEDGMRGQGARLSWLLPTSFYTEAMVTVMNPTGGTTSSFLDPESASIHGGVITDRSIDNAKDLVYVPRITGEYDPTDNTTLLLGASAAFGPNNAGASTRTSIYGVDGYWKWKSPRAAAGFPFMSLQAEYMVRKYDTDTRFSATSPIATLPAGTLNDKGGYVEGLWGIRPRIVAGMRAEKVTADPAGVLLVDRLDRTRLSPNFTWYPTEFSRVRLQYNYDDRQAIGHDSSLWLQFEFIMGAHAAHKF